MATHRPIRHRPTTLMAEVRKADPDWDRESRVDIVYEFSSGKKFEQRQKDFLPYTEAEQA